MCKRNENRSRSHAGAAFLSLIIAAAALFMSPALAGTEEGVREEEPARSALISRKSLYDYDEETYQTYGQGELQGVILSREDAQEHPALAASLKTYSDNMFSELSDRFKEYCEWSRTDHQEYQKDYETFVRTDVIMRRYDGEVFSFVQKYEDYSGGAHGYYSFTGHSFDVKTGEEIPLSTVVTDEEAFRNVVREKLEDKYQNYLEPDLSDLLRSYAISGGEYDYNWVMEHDGISVMFNPYMIAPYAAGAQHIHIGFSEYPDLFTDAYHAQQGAFCYRTDQWLDDRVDLDGDGQFEDFSITWEYDSYDGAMENAGRVSIGVNCGNNSCTRSDLYYFDMKGLMMHTADGRNYLYLDLTSENDYHSIHVFDLSHEAPFWAGSMDAGLAWQWDEASDLVSTVIPMDPESFRLETRMQMLSTYGGYRTYHLDENGMPDTEDPYYIANGSGIKLKTVRDLPVTLIEADSPEDVGTQTGNGIVGAGEELTIWRTDGKEVVDLKKTDGSIVRVRITGTGWPRLIEGEDEESYFERLYYAG